MPISNPNAILVRQFTLNASIAYRNPLYVADRLFPMIDGLNKKSKVPKYVKGPWFRDEAEVRAPGSPPRNASFKISSSNLDPVNYAIETEIPDELVRDSAIDGNFPLDPEVDAALFCADKLDLRRERRTAAVVHAEAWSGQSAGGVDAEGTWASDGTNNTFLADLKTSRDTIQTSTGQIPNKLFIDYPCWSSLQINSALLAYINPTSESRENPLVSLQTLANLAQVEEVIVGMAVYNTDEETVTDSMTGVNVWGTSAQETKGIGFHFFAPSRPSLRTPSAGYQYRIRQANGSGRDMWMSRDDRAKTWYLACEEDVDIAATGLDVAYLWKNTILT